MLLRRNLNLYERLLLQKFRRSVIRGNEHLRQMEDKPKSRNMVEDARGERTTFRKNLDNSMAVLIPILAYAVTGALLLLPLLFVYLNNLQFYYFIDEKFHIPQTLKYCEGNFFEWDPKITTLPGLYLLSALILGPLGLCTTTYLRALNVVCTFINLLLIYKLLSISHRKRLRLNKELDKKKLYVIACNIACFPPLLFYFFLYYTDIFSVTLILIMLLFHINKWNYLTALAGVFAICVRQTNVIWVGFLCIERGLTLIEEITKRPHFTDTLNVLPCIEALYKILKAQLQQGIMSFLRFLRISCSPILPYLLVLLAFIIFVIFNEGIVVGDRTAHKPTVHFTQILYFSIFVLGFSWPYLLTYLSNFLRYTIKHPLIVLCSLSGIALIVHFNTLVHPYILADNRHYTFYIWKNFMNRYSFFKYLLIPVYCFAIYAILNSLNHLRLLSVVSYSLCVCTVLIPQLLLEPRYFIIPYVLFRLHLREPENWQVVLETVSNIILNVAQFFLFANKTFSWLDEQYPQRIAW